MRMKMLRMKMTTSMNPPKPPLHTFAQKNARQLKNSALNLRDSLNCGEALLRSEDVTLKFPRKRIKLEFRS